MQLLATYMSVGGIFGNTRFMIFAILYGIIAPLGVGFAVSFTDLNILVHGTNKNCAITLF
jgi:hypothetical protein